MLGIRKVVVRGIPMVFTLVFLILVQGITSLQATPLCATTITLPGGDGMVLDPTSGSSVCVQAEDKLYGALGGLAQLGSVTFGFVSVGGFDQHSITFTDAFAPGVTYRETLEVEALEGEGFPTNNFNSSVGGPATLAQTTSDPPDNGSMALSKPANSATGPFQGSVTSGQNANSGPNTSPQSLEITTPEPASLELLGIALTGFGIFGLRRKR